MSPHSRREFVALGLSGVGLASCGTFAAAAEPDKADVHQYLLELARRQQAERRAQFAAIQSPEELHALQQSLRQKFLKLIGGLPEKQGVPPVQITGTIEADDYRIEKLVFESWPGYFVSALLYKPKAAADARRPGVISPCGHSADGKAAASYQTLHINLAKRGYVVLTYDPVGQAERSQCWDAEQKKSRFNLVCGEHAVLGNPLYMLGSSLARFRIWDGLRAIDLLESLPEVDPRRIGCVGNSGGGTLTAYIAALDPRVAVAAICCYITTLPRRMGNRIQADPDSDPEQDIFGFVAEGIDHAGLLALRAPRPTLLGTARDDFFPIEGARESFAEARALFAVAGAGERIERVEAAERHGLTLPLRQGVYAWFDRWLAGRTEPAASEFAVTVRPARELLVCADGQVNLTYRSRPLLPMALEEFDRRAKPPRARLRELLRLDSDLASPRVTEIGPGNNSTATTLLCINGNESRDWREEREFLDALTQRGYAVFVIDPRGVGKQRPELAVKGRDYADPLCGVEENIAYNAFLAGKSLAGMRVADVLAAAAQLPAANKRGRIVLCGRRDAAIVACLAAAVDKSITHVATEELLLSFRQLFAAQAQPINAASIVPGLLEQFGDVSDVLAETAPRKVLVAAGIGESPRLTSVATHETRFSSSPQVLTRWLQG